MVPIRKRHQVSRTCWAEMKFVCSLLDVGGFSEQTHEAWLDAICKFIIVDVSSFNAECEPNLRSSAKWHTHSVLVNFSVVTEEAKIHGVEFRVVSTSRTEQSEHRHLFHVRNNFYNVVQFSRDQSIIWPERFRSSQASHWADQAQRQKITLYGDLELIKDSLNRIMQRNSQELNWGEDVLNWGEDVQARNETLSMQQRRKRPLSHMMVQIQDLQNKVKFSDRECKSRSGGTHVPDQ